MIESGFDLERGNSRENEHIPIEKLKVITNYELQELSKESTKLEEEIITNNIEELRLDYKRVIKKINTISKRYTRIKNIVEETLFRSEQLKNENIRLKEEKNKLEKETKDLKDFIEKTFECIHLLFNFPIENLKRIVKDFYKNASLG